MVEKYFIVMKKRFLPKDKLCHCNLKLAALLSHYVRNPLAVSDLQLLNTLLLFHTGKLAARLFSLKCQLVWNWFLHFSDRCNNMDKDENGIIICFNEGGFSRIHVITVPVVLVASLNCLAFSKLHHPYAVAFCFVNWQFIQLVNAGWIWVESKLLHQISF